MKTHIEFADSYRELVVLVVVGAKNDIQSLEELE